MQVKIKKVRQSINKAWLKVKPNRSEIDLFKKNLTELLIDRINENESEEHHKKLVSDFLEKTYYSPNHYINTKGRSDQVIHNGKEPSSTVGVIIEAKKPANKTEMLSKKNVNTKAFQELVLYYLRERITQKNLEIKYLVATNMYEWFIFDAAVFEKTFSQNNGFVKQFTDFEAGRLSGTNTDFFYSDIAKPFIEDHKNALEFTWFDLREYEKPLRNSDKKDDAKLIALYKLFSPEHLLKLPFSNDSNSLDRKFYTELLHLIGLEETKVKGKKLIGRKEKERRDSASMLENAITHIESHDKLSRLSNVSAFGETKEERLFNVALELCITWVNRILFLKLLEAQLIGYQKGDEAYSFLNLKRIKDYDVLDTLFFQVLARKHELRSEEITTEFGNIPYLNSSLFDPTDLEHDTLMISNLRDDMAIPVISGTVLKDDTGKKISGKLSTLEYLFRFLDAYDFTSEGSEAIQEDNKTLINASVLGLIFEKINGYKDGSFFTPGFITMYMCRETIRRAVVQKFNEAKGWKCEDLDDIYDKIEDRTEANEIINSLKICDPAVGSGHFLVSALNEILAIKHDLNILQDRNGRRLKEYELEVVNDELIITDDEGELFEYHPGNKESQRVQETLFHEKQTLIENCLFGVDINPNSVKICRLRLWIELLKHTYYKSETELETLPNIDINIKVGNSLISRFALDADLKEALKKSKWSIDSYRVAVATYRDAQSKEQKREMERLIEDIKNDFRTEIASNDPKVVRLKKISDELVKHTTQTSMFEQTVKEKKEWKKKSEKLTQQIAKLESEIEEIKSNKIYENAFEWRFEFPEVLTDKGDFVGFDVVIGNPPYFSLSKLKDEAYIFDQLGFETYQKGTDIYCLFYERGGKVLKTNGLLTYITSNSWLRAKYGESLKEYFKINLQPRMLLNIEDIQVFEEATVESNIIQLEKKKFTDAFEVCNMENNYIFGSSLEEYISSNSYLFEVPNTSEWLIENPQIIKLKNKIEQKTNQLSEFDIQINFGIKTGFNAAFIVDEEIRTKLVEQDSKNTEILQPILRGRDLRKYSFKFGHQYLINSHNGLKKEGVNPVDLKNEYPTILTHLEKYKPKIVERYDQGDHWSNLRNCAYLNDFERPKIIWGEISDKPKFTYDDEDYYAEATTFLMTGEKLKFLLSILNSKVSEWYFNLIGTTTGMGTNRWKKYKIELLPIKVTSEEQELEFEKKVDQILTLKKANPEADTSALESEIDQMVYELYELTEEEIAIVEESVG